MKATLLAIGLAAVVGTAVWLLKPVPELEPIVPVIVTVYDTVDKTPNWLAESLHVWRSRKATSETVNVYFSNTIIDTQYVPVDAPSQERPNIWPILGYNSSGAFGDTAFIRTYSVRTGQMAVSRAFTAGVLTGIEVDSSSKPKLTFRPFPPSESHTFWNKLQWAGIGVAIGGIVGVAGSATLCIAK